MEIKIKPMTQEEKDYIDRASLEMLLEEWRFAPPGRFDRNHERTHYFMKVMDEKRAGSPGGWTAASKAVGWNP